MACVLWNLLLALCQHAMSILAGFVTARFSCFLEFVCRWRSTSGLIEPRIDPQNRVVGLRSTTRAAKNACPNCAPYSSHVVSNPKRPCTVDRSPMDSENALSPPVNDSTGSVDSCLDNITHTCEWSTMKERPNPQASHTCGTGLEYEENRCKSHSS